MGMTNSDKLILSLFLLAGLVQGLRLSQQNLGHHQKMDQHHGVSPKFTTLIIPGAQPRKALNTPGKGIDKNINPGKLPQTQKPAEKPAQIPEKVTLPEKSIQEPGKVAQSDRPIEKPVEKPTQKPVEKPTEKPVQIPGKATQSEKPTEKLIQKPAEKPSQKPTEKPVQISGKQNHPEKPTQRPAQATQKATHPEVKKNWHSKSFHHRNLSASIKN